MTRSCSASARSATRDTPSRSGDGVHNRLGRSGRRYRVGVPMDDLPGSVLPAKDGRDAEGYRHDLVASTNFGRVAFDFDECHGASERLLRWPNDGRERPVLQGQSRRAARHVSDGAMTRLVDRLRAGLVARSPYTALPTEFDAGGAFKQDPKAYKAFVQQLRDDVASSPVIVIDNVAEYVLGEGSRERWTVDDVPNAAPPWHVAWYEFRVPAEYGRLNDLAEVAMWTAASEREDEGGWRLTMWPFAREPHQQDVVGPISLLIADVRADGTVEALRAAPAHGFATTDEAVAPLILTIPVLLANSFAHCRNVREETVFPAPKLSDRYKKRHGLPLVRYTVLAIDPMREVLRREGRSTEVGAKRALHICRGHFKTYDRKPLFNRLTGTYWFPEHVRGTASAGVVNKTYVVLPAAGDGTVEATAVARAPRRAVRATPEHIAEVEDFSVARAVEIVRERYPGMDVEVQAHSNPGYDLLVKHGGRIERYVEVKGTTADSPGFFISENERRFSAEHASMYSLVLIAEINFPSGSFVPFWHDGPIDERFSLRPTHYTATFPPATNAVG